MSNLKPESSPRLPIKLDSTSNGEYVPIALSPLEQAANKLAMENSITAARHSGASRRAFLASTCGAAATLLAFNQAHALQQPAGRFEIPQDAAHDAQLAAATLEGKEFIFDVQGHYLPPNLARTLKPQCIDDHDLLGREYMTCLGADNFIKDVFLDSDTDMMALSFIPSSRADEPLSIEEAHATREMVERLDGNHRLLLHGRCNPNQPGDLEFMDELAEKWKVSAWKCYTQYGPGQRGFFLSDEDSGIPFIEKARKLGVHNICVHKGIPFGRQSYEHSLCDDIGVVAKAYPDVNFLIYHSGFVPGQAEGPYDPDRNEGVDSLVKTVIENDVPRNSNVYAELGSTWRFLSMRDPGSAAHTLGKLFKHIGENNVLWGTDSVWYGSPQDQIQAFRSFQIDESIREQHGYPEMTPQLRAKVFGLNALRPYNINIDEARERASADELTRAKIAYQEAPRPHFQTYGPKTRREFMNLLRLSGGKIS
ncbi:MAG: amidohydrolase family protein [Xanthomonadales bacterium]|nr:amidohydrolase [Gammaproteobacteria bacterium]NNE06769.1 amidohydrolase family protein [Xanthomonadales bacterium]NNL94351.1 amidohydrolase family protein [Xanthomonadales bacterium]